MEETDKFLDQYQHHIQTAGFGVPGQEALNRSHVLIIGAGSLASPMLSYLTSMGIGHLGIVSDEKISKRDLPSQPLYGSGQQGKLRSQILAARLREINPEVTISLHEQGLNRDNILDLVAGYDLVIDATNSPEKSLLINDACVISGKPMIYGTLNFPNGSFCVLNYKESATLRCILKNPETASLVQQPEKGGLSTLGAVISSLMANEAIKVIGEIGNTASNKLLTFNSLSNQLTSLKVEPVPEHLQITSLQTHYVSGVSNSPSDPSRIRSISPKLLAIKIRYKEPLQLIDLRENPVKTDEESWNYLHIPEQKLLDDLDQIHQDIIVVLLSETGKSAADLAMRLNERHGFDNIYYLEGGMQAWNAQTGKANVEYESF